MKHVKDWWWIALLTIISMVWVVSTFINVMKVLYVR